jgi:hypothetical protein
VRVTVCGHPVVMLVVDARMHVLGTLRQALGTALYPFQTVAMVPRDAFTIRPNTSLRWRRCRRKTANCASSRSSTPS